MSGHILDMVNRIKQNKIPKREKFQGKNRGLLYTDSSQVITQYNFPAVSSENLDRIKTNIRQNAIIRKRKSYLFLIIFIVITVTLGLILLESYKYPFSSLTRF